VGPRLLPKDRRNAEKCTLAADPQANSSPIKYLIRYYNCVERALGFRAEAHKVYWAVAEGTRKAPILLAHDDAAAPVNLGEASALSWYSGRVRHIVETYKPALAMVRSVEPTARGSKKEGARLRLRIEGVLLQTLDSCGLKVSIGALATISGKLGAQAKGYIESGELRGLDLSGLTPYAKEAVLVAVAALP
jgi:hypothetical protein